MQRCCICIRCAEHVHIRMLEQCAHPGCRNADTTTITNMVIARVGRTTLCHTLHLCGFLPADWLYVSRLAFSSRRCCRDSRRNDGALPLCNIRSPWLYTDKYAETDASCAIHIDCGDIESTAAGPQQQFRIQLCLLCLQCKTMLGCQIGNAALLHNTMTRS